MPFTKVNSPLIPAERIQELVQLEPAFLITLLALGTLFVYRFFLRDLSVERHRNLTLQFRNLGYHLTTATVLFSAYFSIRFISEGSQPLERLTPYLGLIALIQEAVVAIKTARIYVFQYLYFSHMRVAFPLLLVNIFSLLLTLAFFGWLASAIFNVRIAPLMATSAVFSLVLGLALQDTIGNLFAGVALQFDKPYEIGDWITVNNGNQTWTGQVHEISWRATVLHGFADEAITIPNKTMSQAQISNYAAKQRPFARSQIFRISFDISPEIVKRALLEAANQVKGIRKDIQPIVIIAETTESWISYKFVYYIENFGLQYFIADEIIEASLFQLKQRGISLASPRMTVLRDHSSA